MELPKAYRKDLAGADPKPLAESLARLTRKVERRKAKKTQFSQWQAHGLGKI